MARNDSDDSDDSVGRPGRMGGGGAACGREFGGEHSPPFTRFRGEGAFSSPPVFPHENGGGDRADPARGTIALCRPRYRCARVEWMGA